MVRGRAVRCAVDDAVAGVKEIELDILERDGFIAVEKQRGVPAAGNALLNQLDSIFQQGFCVAVVLSQERIIGFFVQARFRKEFLKVFFDNQRRSDGIGFDFLVSEFILQKRDEEFILQVQLVHLT